jgi:hypothetical protein
MPPHHRRNIWCLGTREPSSRFREPRGDHGCSSVQCSNTLKGSARGESLRALGIELLIGSFTSNCHITSDRQPKNQSQNLRAWQLVQYPGDRFHLNYRLVADHKNECEIIVAIGESWASMRPSAAQTVPKQNLIRLAKPQFDRYVELLWALRRRLWLPRMSPSSFRTAVPRRARSL